MIYEGQSLKKTFMRFMLPSVAAQWVFALYTMIDGMFVARGVSETALSAINISMPFVTFLFSLSLMFAVGSSTIIAIHFGKGEFAQANRIYTQNLLITVVLSLILTAAVLLNMDSLCYFLGATGPTIGYVREYISTIACFSACFTVAYSFEILIKTDGHPKLATIFVTAGALLHCLLDWIFVILMDIGVRGAALATGSSQAFLVVLYLSYFLGKKATLKLRRFSFNPGDLWRTVKLGLPSGFTEMSAGIVIFLFNNAILAHINEQAIVSYTIVAYVSTIVVMSMTGVAQGFQPLVSFFYGKENMADCEKLLKYGLIAATALAFAIFVPCWLGAGGIVAIYIPSVELAALREYSVAVFRIFSLSFLILGYNVVIGGYFTAIEREKSAVAIAMGRGVVFLAVSLSVLAALFGGPGIWWAALLSEIICLVLTAALFAAYRRSTPRPPKIAHAGQQ